MLRVSAPSDVTRASLEPRSVMGTSGPIADLLYQYPRQQLDVVSAEANTVRFRRRADSTATPALLAASFRSEALKDVSVDGEFITAVFSNETAATEFVDDGFLTLGPYTLFASDENSISLLPKSPGGSRITIVPADNRGHWQLLLGGHIDVAPELWSLDAAELTAVDSVQVVSLETARFLALAYNIERVSLEQRRALQSVLQRIELSPITCPGEACAVSLPASRKASSRVEPAAGTQLEQFTITVLSGDRETERAFRALAVEVWHETGIRPGLEFASAADMGRLLESGDFDCLLGPFVSDASAFYPSFETWMKGLGYASTVSQANQQRDWASAAARFEELALMIPLSARRRLIGISRDWCGAEPTVDSWLWLADLRRCTTEP